MYIGISVRWVTMKCADDVHVEVLLIKQKKEIPINTRENMCKILTWHDKRKSRKTNPKLNKN